jgi:type I restriction enzyme, S subunit
MLLSDLCILSKGEQPRSDEVLKQGHFRYLNGGISASGYMAKANTPERTVTISEGGENCGFVSFNADKIWAGCHCYRCLKPCVPPEYLFFALKNVEKQIRFLRTGVCMPNIRKSSLALLDVPLSFDKNVQTKTIKTLSQIQNFIEKDKAIVNLLEDLVKSRFNEMFGGLLEEPLFNVCDVQMGQSPDSSTYNDKGDGLPFYQGKVDFGDKFIGFNHYCSSPIRIAEASDILMSVRAPVGPVNMTDHECCIGRGLASIRVKKGKADTAFVFAALDLMKDDLAGMGTGSTFKAISRKDIENLLLPSASLEKQMSFGMFSEKIDKLKFVANRKP